MKLGSSHQFFLGVKQPYTSRWPPNRRVRYVWLDPLFAYLKKTNSPQFGQSMTWMSRFFLKKKRTCPNMVTTNSLLVGSDITYYYIHFSHIQKIIGSRKYRHTSLPMLFPCIFKISTHTGPPGRYPNKNDSPTVSQDGNFGLFFVFYSGSLRGHEMIHIPWSNNTNLW